jgi:hypothetical protein
MGFSALAFGITPVFAQAPATRPTTKPSVRPARVQTPPTIDGRLDEPAWRNAARVTQFVQRRPLDGAPASEQTEVLLTYDADRLYFGVIAHYSDPALLRANHVDRDQIWEDDRVSVIFDPFLDQQRGYRIAVNGYGVQGDALVSGGSGGSSTSSGPGDTSWNVLFRSRACAIRRAPLGKRTAGDFRSSATSRERTRTSSGRRFPVT